MICVCYFTGYRVLCRITDDETNKLDEGEWLQTSVHDALSDPIRADALLGAALQHLSNERRVRQIRHDEIVRSYMFLWLLVRHDQLHGSGTGGTYDVLGFLVVVSSRLDSRCQPSLLRNIHIALTLSFSLCEKIISIARPSKGCRTRSPGSRLPEVSMPSAQRGSYSCETVCFSRSDTPAPRR